MRLPKFSARLPVIGRVRAFYGQGRYANLPLGDCLPVNGFSVLKPEIIHNERAVRRAARAVACRDVVKICVACRFAAAGGVEIKKAPVSAARVRREKRRPSDFHFLARRKAVDV